MSDLHEFENELSHLSQSELIQHYAIFSQRLMHVVDVQWKLTSIFIPLSLSGVIFLEGGQRWTIVVAMFSILLIWIWYLFERRNQRSILKQQTMLITLESLLADHNATKSGSGFSVPNRFRGRKIGHTMLFRAIAFSVTLAWIIAVVYAALVFP